MSEQKQQHRFQLAVDGHELTWIMEASFKRLKKTCKYRAVVWPEVTGRGEPTTLPLDASHTELAVVAMLAASESVADDELMPYFCAQLVLDFCGRSLKWRQALMEMAAAAVAKLEAMQ